ncbi:hypothetical protein [Phytoactinopolyspora limicola]|uniref:hypothetical protein n=1 Tax=Phytoactinopolyspora limicola TaxID=2715536 RepID=UPI00140D9F30|nr:hypothetical protein [Phytoactinopolyspora limicola]
MRDESAWHSEFFFPAISPEFAAACLELRRSMYQADRPGGRGAWYNAIIRMRRDGLIAPLYDFSQPPFGHWGPREVDLVRRDQELYPRDPGQLPAWHPAREHP